MYGHASAPIAIDIEPRAFGNRQSSRVMWRATSDAPERNERVGIVRVLATGPCSSKSSTMGRAAPDATHVYASPSPVDVPCPGAMARRESHVVTRPGMSQLPRIADREALAAARALVIRLHLRPARSRI
jgi:hypothetical protein